MPCNIHLESTTSTNNYLKELLLKENIEEFTVVSTSLQTAGRGQQGNSWESEEGKNILFSMVVFPVSVPANEQFIISQIVSLAVKDILNKYTDDITIKWPNDIYWKEKKISGILIENNLMEDHISQSVMGIGININQELFQSNAPNPVSLKQITGKEYDKEIILHQIVEQLTSYFEKLKSKDTADIIHNYKQSLFRREGFHLYNDGKNDFKARIKDIEPSGLLVLETEEGIRHHFAFKEVRYIL